MKTIKCSVIVSALVLLANGVLAQSPKGAEALASKPSNAKTEVPSNVNGKNTVLQSGIKSLGTVGKSRRYEIVQVKVRGLDTPNLAGFLVYDSANDEIVGVQTSGAPGLGVALVNGGSYIAGSYLFGSKLRPNNQNINGGDTSSTSNGGSSTAVGTGGNSSASSTATGGNATGGNANAGQTGGSFTPPGHINNPGHGHGHNPHNP
jgi:hypothetical protein